MQKEIISVVTFGSTKPKQNESHVVEVELPLKDGTSFNLTANVIPEITRFIHRSPVRLGKTAFLWKDLPLANSISAEREISTTELLIGSDYYPELITAEKIELEPGLNLLGSKLGRIPSSRFGKRACNESNASMLIFSCPNQTTLEPVLPSENSPVLSDQNIDDVWRLENIGIKDLLTDAEFSFDTIPKTENSELKTLEFSLRHFDQTRRFSNSELFILHYTQNGTLRRVENLGVFPLGIMIKVGGFPTLSFPFCTILKTENSELKTWEFSIRFTRKTIFFIKLCN